eukprot:jgi/Hompol1/1695/HPOL_002749-RA
MLTPAQIVTRSIMSTPATSTLYLRGETSAKEDSGIPFASPEKNRDFHNLFRGLVHPDERLLIDFVCAFKVGVLVDGKMWVSENHICFRGWMTRPCFVIPFTDITHIQKSNFAGFLPNALEIETDLKQYFFGTIFPPRNPKVELILRVWDSHVDTEYMALSLKGGFVAERLLGGRRSGQRIGSNQTPPFKHKLHNSTDFVKVTSENMLMSPSSESLQDSLSLSSSDHSSTTSSDDLISSPRDSPIVSPSHQMPIPDSATVCPCRKSPEWVSAENFTLVLDTVIPLPLDLLWTQWYCCTPSGSLYSRFLPERMRFRDLQFSQWLPSNSKDSPLTPLQQISDFDHFDVPVHKVSPGTHRITQYIVPLSGPIGPKQTRSINNESILYAKDGHYICQEVHNESPDVSTTFYSIGRTCFSFESPGVTRVRVHWKVVFTSMNFLKGI